MTGASLGIGKEFSRQLAANGLNVVLVARRLELLKELGQDLEKEFGVECRAVQVDLSDENFIGKIKEAGFPRQHVPETTYRDHAQ